MRSLQLNQTVLTNQTGHHFNLRLLTFSNKSELFLHILDFIMKMYKDENEENKAHDLDE